MTLEKIPKALQTLEKPVEKLYFKGNPELLNRFKVAIVGSRKPYNYTKSVVSKLASEISKRGGVVVSGGAMGVDAVAHRGAGKNTIGVFANSLDLIYPKVNKELINGIAQNSLALSEYEETTKARPYFFVQRNRIVTGLSDVVIIAQADLNSGSMRSAEFALKQGKELFVLPHRIGESEGTNYLLENGLARPITDIENFLQSGDLEKREESVSDEVLAFCQNEPDYEEALKRYKDKIFEYELEGKIEIINSKVVVK